MKAENRSGQSFIVFELIFGEIFALLSFIETSYDFQFLIHKESHLKTKTDDQTYIKMLLASRDLCVKAKTAIINDVSISCLAWQ